MNEEKSTAAKAGFTLGGCLAWCVAVSIGGTALLFTAKFLAIVFNWLF